MLTSILAIGCTLSLLGIIYFFRATTHLKRENLLLRDKCSNLEGEFDTALEKITNRESNRFLEIEEVLKKERERIAHELHDDIVQRFVSVRLRLEQLLYFSLRPEVEGEINALRTEIGDALRDLRYVIDNLVKPQIENEDLNHLIEEIVSKMKLITKIKCELIISHPEYAFSLSAPIKKELSLLVREAIQNSLKHSAGNTINVLVSWASDLTIEISADGVGFLKSRAANVGLVSMRQRCAKIGANFQAFNRMGRFHAVVIITLPRSSN